MFITKKFKEELKKNNSCYNPSGYVIIRDKNNNILVDKHNMILIGGRQYIFNSFINNHKQGTAGLGNYIDKAIFSNESNDTVFEILNTPPEATSGNFYFSGGIYSYKIDLPMIRNATNESNPGVEAYEFNTSSETQNEVKLSSEVIEGHNVLCLSFSIEGDAMGNGDDRTKSENIAITSLYLGLHAPITVVKSTMESASATAFSKIVFDPIPLFGLDELIIDYYIYF